MLYQLTTSVGSLILDQMNPVVHSNTMDNVDHQLVLGLKTSTFQDGSVWMKCHPIALSPCHLLRTDGTIPCEEACPCIAVWKVVSWFGWHQCHIEIRGDGSSLSVHGDGGKKFVWVFFMANDGIELHHMGFRKCFHPYSRNMSKTSSAFPLVISEKKTVKSRFTWGSVRRAISEI